VEPGSPAAVAGIEPGDLLLAVGEQEIDGVDRLAAAVAGRRVVSLRIWRDGGEAWAIVAGLPVGE
ncbi:MAG: PDZ domain-containing protein, partial [Deltaproteobacteria bacterium]